MFENEKESEIIGSNSDRRNLEQGLFSETPLQLIDFNNGNFVLNSNAMSVLKGITDEIIIVSIVGKARTGKSYLMNLLLQNTGKTRGVKYNYI